MHPIARPSSPSVRFTALLEPTITSITNAMNGRKASGHSAGMPTKLSITRSGRNCLKNGTTSRVEYIPRVCIAINATAIR